MMETIYIVKDIKTTKSGDYAICVEFRDGLDSTNETWIDNRGYKRNDKVQVKWNGIELIHSLL